MAIDTYVEVYTCLKNNNYDLSIYSHRANRHIYYLRFVPLAD